MGADSKLLLKQLAHSGYQYTVASTDGPGTVSLPILSGDKELLGQENIFVWISIGSAFDRIRCCLVWCAAC